MMVYPEDEISLIYWAGDKLLKAYHKGFMHGRVKAVKEHRAEVEEAYGNGFEEGSTCIKVHNKLKLADAYNSGYRDSQLDRREGHDNTNKRSNCSSCTYNPDSSIYKSTRQKKTSPK